MNTLYNYERQNIMSVIQNNLNTIIETLQTAAVCCNKDPDHIQLIAVSKRKSVDLINQAIASGVRHIGENYIQEAIEKIDRIGKNAACWHFIGHLQSNKARLAVPYFDYIHTVDSIKLAKEISKQAKKIDKYQKILIQVNISNEPTKSGTRKENLLDLVTQISDLDHIRVNGLMCIPPFFEDPEHARVYFKQLADLKTRIMAQGIPNINLEHLSMGMSNDFEVAIQEGATMVRVGTAIFGARD
jgi:pyridoxal phosphate enzyme (YggS family)